MHVWIIDFDEKMIDDDLLIEVQRSLFVWTKYTELI